MKKLNRIYALLCLIFVLSSCAKSEGYAPTESAMLFGIDEITQTRVIYGDQSDGGYSATFSVGDNLGLYAFYNNFYYHYDEYNNFAESVLFANQGLTVSAHGGATYSPLRSWTFSTLYGSSPHTLDCVAYYPFEANYNPKYVNMVHDDSGAATLEYRYVGYMGDEDPAKVERVNADIDFMTAHTRIDEYADDHVAFRDAMLLQKKIDFSFKRQMASLNLQVSKPDKHTPTIIVTGITVYFDACKKFTQTIDNTPEIQWSEMTTGYSLEASAECNKELAITNWTSDPGEGAISAKENLLDKMLFFPPGTDINKVVFTLTDGGDSKTYTWHPHVEPIVANTHYILRLELDPARAN